MSVQAGTKVALDLASFEVVRAFLPELLQLLRSGGVEVCFCNEVQAHARPAREAGTVSITPRTGLVYVQEGCKLCGSQCEHFLYRYLDWSMHLAATTRVFCVLSLKAASMRKHPLHAHHLQCQILASKSASRMRHTSCVCGRRLNAAAAR